MRTHFTWWGGGRQERKVSELPGWGGLLLKQQNADERRIRGNIDQTGLRQIWGSAVQKLCLRQETEKWCGQGREGQGSSRQQTLQAGAGALFSAAISSCRVLHFQTDKSTPNPINYNSVWRGWMKWHQCFTILTPIKTIIWVRRCHELSDYLNQNKVKLVISKKQIETCWIFWPQLHYVDMSF